MPIEVLMSYEEVKYSDGSFRRVWENGSGELHREDGPAIIWYNSDGSIFEEDFYLHGKCLGENKEGFLMLWGRLSDEKRQSPEILKCLAKYL
jgi:hypothetical protein